jgi:hypothetical protein
MPYVAYVLGAHVANTMASVFAPITSKPKILVMYGFIVSIHGLLAMTLTLYFGLEDRPGR